MSGKTLLGDVNKLFVVKSLLTTPSNVLPVHLKQTFPPIIWIFTEGESDGIKSRQPFKIFSTLRNHGMDVNDTSSPTTPLHWAAKEGQAEAISALLDLGADPQYSIFGLFYFSSSFAPILTWFWPYKWASLWIMNLGPWPHL